MNETFRCDIWHDESDHLDIGRVIQVAPNIKIQVESIERRHAKKTIVTVKMLVDLTRKPLVLKTEE